MRKIFVIFGILLIIGLVLVRGWRNNDFRLGIVTPDRVALLSISPGRGMINLLTINPEVQVWLPGGMGWYQSNKIKKIYEADKDIELVKKMFYYNFGFMPEDVAFFNEVKDWRDIDLVKYLGIVDWFRYLVEQENWLYKTEVLSRDFDFEKEKLDEILPRDFADNELLGQEIKISVLNSTEENGLGAFVADRLDWMGFNVVAVESRDRKAECEIMTNTIIEAVRKKYVDLLAEVYACSKINNETLLPGEVVLDLGQNYATMINYSSYIR